MANYSEKELRELLEDLASDDELRITIEAMESIRKKFGLHYSQVKRPAQDPPDVLAIVEGVEKGIEVTRLPIPGLKAKRARIDRVASNLHELIEISEKTRDWSLSIFLQQDDKIEWETRGLVQEISDTANQFFIDPPQHISAPGTVSTWTRELPSIPGKISFSRARVHDDERLPDANAPLVHFGASLHHINPVEDIPPMLETRLKEKFSYKLPPGFILLLWNEHPELSGFENGIIGTVRTYSIILDNDFEEIWYYDRFMWEVRRIIL